MQTAPPRCSKWWWQNGESLPNQSPWQEQSKGQSRRKRPSKTRKKRFLLWHQEGSQWPRWPCWPGISWYHFKKQSPKVHVWPCFACMLFRMASSGVYNQTLLYLIQYLHIEQKEKNALHPRPFLLCLRQHLQKDQSCLKHQVDKDNAISCNNRDSIRFWHAWPAFKIFWDPWHLRGARREWRSVQERSESVFVPKVALNWNPDSVGNPYVWPSWLISSGDSDHILYFLTLTCDYDFCKMQNNLK